MIRILEAFFKQPRSKNLEGIEGSRVEAPTVAAVNAPAIQRQLRRGLTRHRPALFTVLVEEEERICRFWREYFAERDMAILTFQEPEEFLNAELNNGRPIQFYFDQDFGSRRSIGTELARIVRDWPGRMSTALVTAYEPSDFESEIEDGVLDRVLPKYPDDIFPSDFFEQRIQREADEVGHTKFIESELNKLAEGIRRGLSPAQA